MLQKIGMFLKSKHVALILLNLVHAIISKLQILNRELCTSSVANLKQINIISVFPSRRVQGCFRLPTFIQRVRVAVQTLNSPISATCETSLPLPENIWVAIVLARCSNETPKLPKKRKKRELWAATFRFYLRCHHSTKKPLATLRSK